VTTPKTVEELAARAAKRKEREIRQALRFAASIEGLQIGRAEQRKRIFPIADDVILLLDAIGLLAERHLDEMSQLKRRRIVAVYEEQLAEWKASLESAEESA